MFSTFFDKVKTGLARTRAALSEGLAAIVPMGARLSEEALEEIEALLIQADVGLETAGLIADQLRERLRQEKIEDGPAGLRRLLQEQIAAALSAGEDHHLPIEGELPARPFAILVVGVNGTGKTTTVGKLARQYVQAGHQVLVAACDTFRAAAVPQLEVWAERAGADLVRAQSGADPAAVAFDAFSAARARGADVLIADTAGRLHTRVNLMEELKKIRRSLGKLDPMAPHETLLVLDATTGQNALSQAREFHQATQVTGLVLTKLDGTAKGGIVVALKRELGLPVKLIGTGEGLDDVQPFDSAAFARALFEG
jgi:fused signal recognition particle receptor